MNSGQVTVTGGLVDLQVNGFASVDFNTPGLTGAGLDRALRAMLATGVTRCLPTLITGGEANLSACFRALEAAVAASDLGREMVAGYHLEGPFISPEDGFRGCHPAAHVRPADPALFDRLQEAANGRIRLVTLAPEVPGALDLIERLFARGITVALGHTAADPATLREAAARGASLSTHLGNGSARLVPKGENPILSQLADDRLMASFIADGVHIPPETLKVYMRAKGLDRTILVTDAVAGASAAPGDYRLGDLAIARGTEPVIRLAGTPDLAGSALCLDQAARNVMAWFGLTLEEAVRLARDNPLRAIGEASGRGRVWWRMDENGPRVEKVVAGPIRWESEA
jgi:N-acetylglucosamine-6-phosphate deacetylase